MNEENAHSVAIGGFIVGALLIAVVTLLFVLGSGLPGQRQQVVMVFDGSVKGLTIGAPVALRGVEIGEVTGINLLLDEETMKLIMVVEASVSSERIQGIGLGGASSELIDELIARGLRAQLNLQSLLTGLLYVQLDFHPDTAVQLADIDSDRRQIPTIPTGLERFTRQIESLDIAAMANDVQEIAQGLKALVQQEDVHALPGELRATLASLKQTSEALNHTVQAAGPQLDSLLESSAGLVADSRAELPRLFQRFDESLGSLEQAAGEFGQAMQQIDSLVGEDSATTWQLNQALRELTQAGRALQSLARTLEEQPEALLRGKQE